jgi:hypothetical protein
LFKVSLKEAVSQSEISKSIKSFLFKEAIQQVGLKNLSIA